MPATLKFMNQAVAGNGNLVLSFTEFVDFLSPSAQAEQLKYLILLLLMRHVRLLWCQGKGPALARVNRKRTLPCCHTASQKKFCTSTKVRNIQLNIARFMPINVVDKSP
jgi:hypothetical protein